MTVLDPREQRPTPFPTAPSLPSLTSRDSKYLARCHLRDRLGRKMGSRPETHTAYSSFQRWGIQALLSIENYYELIQCMVALILLGKVKPGPQPILLEGLCLFLFAGLRFNV